MKYRKWLELLNLKIVCKTVFLIFFINFVDQHENRWELRDTGYFSQLVRRQKREIPKNTAYTMHIPNYYQDYLDGIKRYVELAFVADNSIVGFGKLINL